MSFIARPEAVDRLLESPEAFRELVVGFAQRGLGLDAEPSRQLRDGEEQVAHLLFGARLIDRARRLDDLAQLVDFFLDLGDDVAGGAPFEADRRGAGADVVGAQQRRQRRCDAAEQRLAGWCSPPRSCALISSHRIRTWPDESSAGFARVAREDVRVAAHQLVGDAPRASRRW